MALLSQHKIFLIFLGRKEREKKRNSKNTRLTAKKAKYHLFWEFLAKKHCFRNKWQTTTFSRTRVSETRVPHQFCHGGTTELDLCD